MSPGDPTDGPVAPTPALHVVLYRPEIAANTGAIGRTCVAVGARLWLVRPLGFHLDEKRRRRAGLDYWDHLDVRVIDALEDLDVSGRLWFFSGRAPLTYTSASYTAGDALVFGPESRGLPESLLDAHPEKCVRIPMRSGIRSLNLANSAAIGAYEAMRQIGGLT